MANTTNLDLVKPAGTDHALISVLNSNSDKIDAFAGQTNDSLSAEQNGLAYIVGNTNTTGGTLAVGQFVYVKGHSTIAEGLRKVTASISANGSITTSNTSDVSGGGLNELNSKITYQSGDSISFTTACAFGRAFDSGSGCIFSIVLEKNIPTGKTVTITKNGSMFAYAQGQTVVISALAVQNHENNVINAQATFETSVTGGSPIIIQPLYVTISIS